MAIRSLEEMGDLGMYTKSLLTKLDMGVARILGGEVPTPRVLTA